MSMPPPQKVMSLPVGLLEVLGVHARSRALHRVERVEASLDEQRDDRIDRAAAVLEGLPVGVAVDPVVDLLIVRQIELAELVHRAELRALGAEVGAADEGNVDLVADRLPVLLEVLDRDLGLRLEDLMHIIWVQQRRHVPVLYRADALGL